MKKLLTFLILVASTAHADGYPVYKMLKTHTYDIGRGTAFAIKYRNKYFTVTNAHVCDVLGSTIVARNDLRNDFTKVEFIAKFHRQDLCLLSATEADGLEVGPAIPMNGGQVYTAGYPSTYREKLHLSGGFTTGISSFEGHPEINSTLYCWFGASGSPVVNSKGQLVGVMATKIGEDPKKATGNFIPIKVLTDILDSLQTSSD